MGIAPPALRERERVRSHRSDLPAGHNIPRVFGRYDNRLITSQYRPNASEFPPNLRFMIPGSIAARLVVPLAARVTLNRNRYRNRDRDPIAIPISISTPASRLRSSLSCVTRRTAPYVYEERSRSDSRRNFGKSYTQVGIDAPTRRARLTQKELG